MQLVFSTRGWARCLLGHLMAPVLALLGMEPRCKLVGRSLRLRFARCHSATAPDAVMAVRRPRNSVRPATGKACIHWTIIKFEKGAPCQSKWKPTANRCFRFP